MSKINQKLNIYNIAKPFLPSFYIDLIPKTIMNLIKNLSKIFVFVYLIIVLFAYAIDFLLKGKMFFILDEAWTQNFYILLDKYFYVLTIAFLVALPLFLVIICLQMFRSYYYLLAARRVFEKADYDITYEAASVYKEEVAKLTDLVLEEDSNFLLKRLQLDRGYIIKTFGNIVLPEEINKLEDDVITIGFLWRYVYDKNEDFAHYLLTLSIKKETFYRVTFWMDRHIENKKIESAWWWRENLSRVGSLAKNLSYGFTGYISHYAYEMALDNKMSELGDVILHQKECNELEEILAKGYGSNAVIVGPHGSGRYTVTLALAKLIKEGYAYSEIKDKRMFLLKPSSFELINDKVEFENSVINVFNEALIARNIIFVIDDITKFVDISKNFGIDFWSLIDSYINHSSVSLVVLTDESTVAKGEYKKVFEKRFETIKMRDLNIDLLLPYLEDKAFALERLTGKLFTYSSLEVIAESLEVFFVEDSPLVKTNDFLESVITFSSSKNIITKEDVYEHLKNVTGVPLGKVKEKEKDNFLHLEEILTKRVIGQKEAVSAVAKTMRRVRSGINERKKPMGTFLFFGPTGTGKTETAKTLAEVFFGSEEYMSRIDMGEYSLPESLDRLIGSSESEGELAKLIHSRSHGVLLLDEFEKASDEVKDMFLRILDEGIFTNGEGKTISLRTQIIVATSNAGTEFLMEYSGSDEYKNKTFDEVKQKVIDFVLEKSILKPELINRFDETIMFTPLSLEATNGVISKMLNGVSSRMKEKSFIILWDEDVVDYIRDNSQVKEFGGRSIKRFIQDTVEDVLSKKIIDGSLNEGDTITLSKADLE